MIRKFGVLVTTIALLLGLGALAAGGAQAVEFRAEGKEKLAVRAQPPAPLSFLRGTTYVDICLSGKLSGSIATESASSLTLSPELGECALPWITESCDFVFDAAGTFDIAGSLCATAPMQINSVCKYRIGPQENLSGITYTNEGKGSERVVKAALSAKKVHFLQVGGSCAGGLGTFVNGELLGTFILRAENGEGKQKGLWVE